MDTLELINKTLETQTKKHESILNDIDETRHKLGQLEQQLALVSGAIQALAYIKNYKPETDDRPEVDEFPI